MRDSEMLASPRRSLGAQLPEWLRHPATLAAGGFLFIRAIGVLVLALSPARAGQPLIEVLAVWDGGWYTRIAESGYADHLDLSSPATDQTTGSLAFFPAYPMLIRLLSELSGLDARGAGVLISVTAGACAAAGIAILASDWGGRRVGLLAGLLWACAPMAVVGTLVYTETLFTAFAVWAFIALRRDQWLLAGVLGAAAGLTRPTGLAVGAAIAAYGVWTWWRRSHDRGAPTRPGSGGLPLIAGAIALAGTPAFWVWAALRADRWDAWFAVQNAFWGSHFDGGASILILARTVVLGDSVPGSAPVNIAVLVCLVAAVVLLVLSIRGRVWWPLLVYAGISMVMVIGSDGYASSKMRFLVPIFVLAFPLARWLGGRSWQVQSVVVVAAVVVTTVVGTWMLQVWPYAI